MLLFMKQHGTLWHEVDLAFGKFIRSMRDVAPEVQFDLVRAYGRIEDMPRRSGQLLDDFDTYLKRKISMIRILFLINLGLFL